MGRAPGRRRAGTATTAFGTGRREAHDASAFYARFRPPELSTDDAVAGPVDLDPPLRVGDARALDLPDRSVALVVTSPPYFVGKEYEAALGQGEVPATYLEFLQLLRDVFAECRRVLEPGGRIAVNVANLGRKPYRSLAADVGRILEEDLGLLLRGEVIWLKAEGASGSCAWGSFRSPANPVLRDLTERVVVASKGRFDRARSPKQRRAEGLPWRSTLTNDEFLEATLDVWRIPAEQARRVGHPAPFPVALPQRLIELHTYEGDLVLDPFLGSGSTAVAAARTGRRWAGYDLDPGYVATAEARVAAELAGPGPDDRWALALAEGRGITELAAAALRRAGFADVRPGGRVPGTGVAADLAATDAAGTTWSFLVSGAFTAAAPGGLARSDELLRCLGRVAVLGGAGVGPLVLLTSSLPPPGSAGERALRVGAGERVVDAVELLDPAGAERLAAHARAGAGGAPAGAGGYVAR